MLSNLVTHRYADLGDVRLHYVEAGEGPLVVLLHGFPQFWYMWRFQIPALAEAGFRVVAPDMRGYNLSEKPREVRSYRVELLARDVERLIPACGEASAVVVGHDWGGLVAWALGAWHPDRVRTLSVLSVPHPAAMAKAIVTSDQALRSYYMGVFQVPLLPERLLLAGEGAALRRVLRHGGLPEDVVEHYVARMREPGALSAALGWYRAIPFGARDAVGKVRVPTLHVWSTGDAFLGRAGIEATERFVDAPYRLEVLDDVTHWIPELAAGRTAELVTAHVRG